MKLSELQDGQRAIICKIQLSHKDTKRLFYIGMYVGAYIEKIRKAPAGDPILFYVCGNQVILRSKDALKIDVEVKE